MDAAINRVRAGPESVTIRNQLTSVISQSGYVHSSVINWRRVTTSYHLVVRIGDLGQHRVVCSSDVRRETRGGGVWSPHCVLYAPNQLFLSLSHIHTDNLSLSLALSRTQYVNKHKQLHPSMHLPMLPIYQNTPYPTKLFMHHYNLASGRRHGNV